MNLILRCVLTLLLMVNCGHLYAQVPAGPLQGLQLRDSLLRELRKQKEDTNKVYVLAELSYFYHTSDPNEGIKYGQAGLELSEKLNWKSGIAISNDCLGKNHEARSEYQKALDFYLKALKIYDEAGDNLTEEKVLTLNSIVTVYSYQNNFPEAARYYQQLTGIPQKHEKINFYTGALLGIFIFAFFYNLFLFRSVGDKSIKYVVLSVVWFLIIYSVGIAHPGNRIELYLFNCCSFGIAIFVLAKLYLKFIHHFMVENGIAVFNERQISKNTKLLNIIFAVLFVMMFMVYCLKLRYETEVLLARMFIITCDVIILSQMGYTLAIFIKNELYKIKGFRFIALSQVILSSGILISVLLTFVFHVPNTLTELAFASCIILQSISIADKINYLKLQKEQAQESAMVFLEEKVTERTSELVIQKKRSDDLLLNILPAEVADELKEKGSAAAKMFDNVTVLFTDFVNFTNASEHMLPQELIDELHTCFKVFDEITTKYKIEKIKTIGDAYLAVAGLPSPDPEHAEHIVRAALEINTFMQTRRAKPGNKTFEIRIGIHSGSVVAGIVGVRKFAYDIWGDTVNTAARMEQNSEAGKINISETTYELVKDKFNCAYRGEIEAKGKGMMKMYYIV